MNEEISKWFGLYVNILMDFLGKEWEMKPSRTLWGPPPPHLHTNSFHLPCFWFLVCRKESSSSLLDLP